MATSDLGAQESAAKRAFRSAAIVTGIQAGRSKKALADDYGISQRQVTNILKAWAAGPTRLDIPPLELLRDSLSGWDHLEHHLSLLAEHAADSNLNVALGALKAIADVRQRRDELLTAVGKLPREMEAFRSVAALRQLLDELHARLIRMQAGELEAVDVVEYLEDVALGRRSLQGDVIDAQALPEAPA